LFFGLSQGGTYGGYLMRNVLVVGFLGIISACSTGVQTSVKMGTDLFNFRTNKDAGQQIKCIDNGMLRSGLKYDIVQTVDGWTLTTSHYGGAITGYIDTSKTIRQGSEIKFYGDAGNFGLDAMGVRGSVEPIVKVCV
jgi:hypothetical protein